MTDAIRNLELIRPERIQPGGQRPNSAQQPAPSRSFGEALQDALHDVDADLNAADRTATAYVTGEGGDLHNVMLELEQVDLKFRAMLQMRNKLLEAYKEVMRMQV